MPYIVHSEKVGGKGTGRLAPGSAAKDHQKAADLKGQSPASGGQKTWGRREIENKGRRLPGAVHY
jgi:hypothetical protein